MNDNEIIKALECCSDEMGCTKGCPCLDEKKGCKISNEGLSKFALDLINRQKEEISELHHRNSELEIELKAMRGAANSCKAEIERLNKENEHFADIGKMYSEIKAEAIKEFAERLKKQIHIKEIRDVYGKKIDNLVKEMVGDV